MRAREKQDLVGGLCSAPLRGTIIVSDAHFLSGVPDVKPPRPNRRS